MTANEIKLNTLLIDFAKKENNGWEPNWEDLEEEKWFCFRTCQIRKGVKSFEWIYSYNFNSYFPGVVYFKNEEIARRAYKEIIIPFETADKR